MGTKLNQIYRCNVCGNIIEIIHTGADSLVCCGQKMELLAENSVDASTEKHVPVIKKSAGGIIVQVGEIPHPMEKEHYIEWIEIVVDGEISRKFLNPGDKPEAEFNVSSTDVIARAYCNLHGLWKSE